MLRSEPTITCRLPRRWQTRIESPSSWASADTTHTVINVGVKDEARSSRAASVRYTVLGARPGTSEPISSTDNGTVHRCAGARVTSVADFHEQLGAGRLGVAQPTMEGAADLHSLAGDRITPTETISSQTRGAFPHARAEAQRRCHRCTIRLQEGCWMSVGLWVVKFICVQVNLSVCAGKTGGAGGDRTHDQGIMSPAL